LAKTTAEIPSKLFYKIGEVCEITDTQPYVLRFWESEFPQLSPKKNRSGQRVYQKKDIETVVRIKELLYEEEYTIAGARKKLDEEASSGRKPSKAKTRAHRAKARLERVETGGEAEHFVDALASRASRVRRPTSGAVDVPDKSEQQVKMEKALRELKGSLKEVLSLMKRS
jgi:DNA-binding transcriptional MerR regulator